LKTTVRNRFPPPASLKELEDVLEEEWYKISATDSSKLVRVHSKKDCGCTGGKICSTTILIMKCVQYL
jgi:hypothetical protein